MESRISVKHKNPNPLFEKWLIQWRDQAKEKNSKSQHTYSLALSSLRRYPLPLERGKDCKILKGFGNKLCQMLDEALGKYKSDSMNSAEGNTIKTAKKIRSPTNIIRNDSSEGDDYIPSYRTGAYAILIAMYKKSLENDYRGYMLKKEIIEEAQPYCDTSFTKAPVGSYYTSWNSMKTLLSKKLVTKESNPAKFSLTNKGYDLGCKCFREMNKGDSQTSNDSISVDECRKNTGDKDIIVLSDSSDDESCEKINQVSPQQSVPASKELQEICGVFLKNNSNENFKEAQKITSSESSSGEKSEKTKLNEIANFEDFIMEPYSFDVLLFVDTAETSGKQNDPKNDAILSELQRLNVVYEVRNLKVGDYCWICRHRISGKELVTPYLVERKRMDDLASSIKDGRFHEQKNRMKQCGLSNIIYMVESYGTKDQHVGMPLSSLNQAIINTLIQDRFVVKIVEGPRGVAEYLSCMSNLIRKQYEKKTIASCPKQNLSPISLTDSLVSLMYFKEFNKASMKTKSFMVKEMFIRHLLQLSGVSVDKATAIADKFPTPKLFKRMIDENGRKSVSILSDIKYGKLGKKIGPQLSETLFMFYSQVSF